MLGYPSFDWAFNNSGGPGPVIGGGTQAPRVRDSSGQPRTKSGGLIIPSLCAWNSNEQGSCVFRAYVISSLMKCRGKDVMWP